MQYVKALQIYLAFIVLISISYGFLRMPSLRKIHHSRVMRKFSVITTFPIYYNDVYTVPLPKTHRFPMDKYRKVRRKVEESLEALSKEYKDKVFVDLRVSPLATYEEITTTHCPLYLSRYLRGDMSEKELRRIGFPWSLDGVRRTLSSVGGTVSAATFICSAKKTYMSSPERNISSTDKKLFWSGHLAGGTHHAFYDRGEGYCIFSDIAVAANVVRSHYPDIVKRILILDLDVHQGNGNAVLFRGREDVFTFSMHCASNYFSKKEESNLDIELPAGCNDETYLSTLRYWLKKLKSEAGIFDLVFFQGGVDILGGDRLGKLNLTQEGVSRRNNMVYEYVGQMNALLCITQGGGYPSDDNWSPVVNAHAGVYLDAYKYLCNL